MTPDAYTIQSFMLPVGEGHELFVHEWGNPKAAQTVFFLHGGPGSGCRDSHKSYFDPLIHHVVFHDQRGSGKSTYTDQFAANTTQHLIADITTIADTLSIDQFVITGGSWGSCLALTYALAHPKRVTAMILRGIFTGSAKEIEWLDKGGFQTFFPDVWGAYLAATPAEHHDNPSAYHFDKITHGTPEEQKRSAYAYENMEGAIMSLDDRFTPELYDTYDPSGIQIEMHYLQQQCFLPANHILQNAKKLTMPIWLVQGRYDAVCPPVTAYRLHQALPHSQLIWATAGHSGGNRATYDVTRSLLLSLAA